MSCDCEWLQFVAIVIKQDKQQYRVFHVGCCCVCAYIRIHTYSNITWYVLPNHVTSHNLAAIVSVWYMYMYMHGCRVVRMDPNFSTTLLNLLSSVSGADSLPQKFPLLFSNSQNPMAQWQASYNSSSEMPQGNCTTKVGTQVNVITGGSSGAVGQLNMKSPSTVVSHASKGSDTIDIPIKVVNPTNKRESKAYILSLQLEIKSEYVPEQLGKSVVSFSLQFDVGYFSGIHKICFIENDNIRTELKHWCDGLSPKSRARPIVCIDSDSDDEPQLRSPNIGLRRNCPVP